MKKLNTAISLGLLFFIVSNPIVYRLVDSVINGVASPSGCPTTLGLVVHSLVFATLVYYGIAL